MRKLKGLILFLLSVQIQAETLTILNWEEYLSPSVIEAWQAKSGHSIKQIYYDNDEDRDSVLIDYTGNTIDLVVTDEMAAKFFGEQGTLLAIKEYQAANTQGIDAEWQQLCGEHSIPYLWGTLGIAYRKDKVAPPSSWGEILHPSAELKYHYGLMEDYTDLLAPALFFNNKSINTENQAELKEAFELSKDAASHALTFDYGISFITSSEQREDLYMTLAYSGDQYALNAKAGKEVWDYTTLKEGTVTWVDCMAVLQNSPRKQIAFDFLNYLYDAKVAARNSEDVYVATPLPQAKVLQSEEFINDVTVYPPEAIMAKLQRYKKLSDENVLLRHRITASLVKLNESK